MITKINKMLKSKALLLSAFVCGFTFAAAQAQTVTSKKTHSKAHKELLASRSKSSDQIKLVDKNKFIDLIDEVEPEIDIFTEGWNSRSVNPFKEQDVPNTKTIVVTGYHMPCPGQITSNYGYRPKFGRMHKGVDLHIRSNDTIYAAFDGKVRLTNFEAKGYGNYVILRHPNGLETIYGHLNKFLVKPNQTVKAGQPIALGGSTGRSTGPHLHFETRFMGYAINPNAIFDFANHTTHTDTYTFSKSNYTQPRNYAPSVASNNGKNSESSYKSGSNVSTYTVKAGDTIQTIARSYGISATTLKKLNGLTSVDKLKEGQVLKLK